MQGQRRQCLGLGAGGGQVFPGQGHGDRSGARDSLPEAPVGPPMKNKDWGGEREEKVGKEGREELGEEGK